MKGIFRVGEILKDIKNLKLYRVISITSEDTILCEMNISTFRLTLHNTPMLIQLLSDREITKEEEDEIIFDINSLSVNAQEKYLRKQEIITEVIFLFSLQRSFAFLHP